MQKLKPHVCQLSVRSYINLDALLRPSYPAVMSPSSLISTISTSMTRSYPWAGTRSLFYPWARMRRLFYPQAMMRRLFNPSPTTLCLRMASPPCCPPSPVWPPLISMTGRRLQGSGARGGGRRSARSFTPSGQMLPPLWLQSSTPCSPPPPSLALNGSP